MDDYGLLSIDIKNKPKSKRQTRMISNNKIIICSKFSCDHGQIFVGT
jgi:hypothetical protein